MENKEQEYIGSIPLSQYLREQKERMTADMPFDLKVDLDEDSENNKEYP